MRDLQSGLRGQDVLDAQCALTALGLYSDDIDGVFGGHLQAAVRAFQQSRALAPTGIIDKVTAAALGLSDPPACESALPDVTAPAVHALFPGTPLLNLETNLPYILNALAAVRLHDRNMVLVALATMATEAASFLPVSERVWSANTTPGGQPFDRYASMLGNLGLEDAAKFRGRGFIQITGRYNYLAYSKKIFGDTRLVENPLLAHQPAIAAQVLAFYLADRESKFRTYLAHDDLADARALVNGGDMGLARFTSVFTEARKLPCILQLALK